MVLASAVRTSPSGGPRKKVEEVRQDRAICAQRDITYDTFGIAMFSSVAKVPTGKTSPNHFYLSFVHSASKLLFFIPAPPPYIYAYYPRPHPPPQRYPSPSTGRGYSE